MAVVWMVHFSNDSGACSRKVVPVVETSGEQMGRQSERKSVKPCHMSGQALASIIIGKGGATIASG